MKRPNILFYFSDQQRSDTCGCYGQPLTVTPNLDVIAKEGTMFRNAFTPQPVCGPCRAIFQTGKYASEIGCIRNGIALPENVKTLANYMEESGYETAYVGKWHLGSTLRVKGQKTVDVKTTAIPIERRGGYTGYWRAVDLLEYTSHGYDGYVFDENNNKCEFKGYRADCTTDFALDYLNQYNSEKPFFLTISYIEPHHQNDRDHFEGPIGSKEKFKDFVLPKDLETLGGTASAEYPDYLGQCNSIDNNLGRVVAKLKEMGEYDNTFIIYVSDHGCHFKTRNKNISGECHSEYKRAPQDAALRVPLIIKGPGVPQNHVVDEVVSTVGLTKTLLSVAGIQPSDKLEGNDFTELAKGDFSNYEDFVFAQISESRLGRCIRNKNYMYSVFAPGKSPQDDCGSDTYEEEFFYDLQKDPYQLNNLIKDTSLRPVIDEFKAILIKKILEVEKVQVSIVESNNDNY